MRDKPHIIDEILADLAKQEPRDYDGLTNQQRRFFIHRAALLSDRAALDEIKATMADLIRWQDEPAFMSAYRRLVPSTSLEQAKRGINSLLPDALQILILALSGEEVTKQQRWAVERLFKAVGLEKLFVESTHTNVPYEARLALAMAERGLALPPALEELLLRFFPEVKSLPQVVQNESKSIDAEFKVCGEAVDETG